MSIWIFTALIIVASLSVAGLCLLFACAWYDEIEHGGWDNE